ncbi:hypothetical protein VB776_20385 [Arcicella sp. DC2W]|uniref:Uncharacterized protein n=1 Tax=Arcicella gelida TaxID=2984195 RepID=A0ABU5SA05_9BACT|nr:hypothetical protein [Arcicella sp. DC2W]MEA5405307.1 hypothetical protein [Arcicella sp. DC2W]
MKQKLILTFILYFFIFYPSFSQFPANPCIKKGFLMDSIAGKTLAFVRFSLSNIPHSTLGLQVINADESFSMNNLYEGNDSLSLVCGAYVAKSINIIPKNKNEADLDILLLIPNARELREVIIKTSKTNNKEEVRSIAKQVLKKRFVSNAQKTAVSLNPSMKYIGDNVERTISIIYKRANYTWCFYLEWR